MSPPPTALDATDLAQRRPVWAALSELWLDTELDDADHARIAAVLAASPYPLAQLRRIHEDEVAPVLWTNLLSVAGVWSGFAADWLDAQCQARAGRRPGLRQQVGRWLRRPVIGYFTDRHWQAIAIHLAALRAARGGTPPAG